jgi:predicted nucleic acid-binding protein
MTFSVGQPAVVVDASAALATLGGEASWSDRWRTWIEADALILAPAHFAAEVANALPRSVKLEALDVANRLERLFGLGLEQVDRGLRGLVGAVELADRHGLSVYDAIYIDLALDVDAELATLDRDLAAAARSEGLAVIG